MATPLSVNIPYHWQSFILATDPLESGAATTSSDPVQAPSNTCDEGHQGAAATAVTPGLLQSLDYPHFVVMKASSEGEWIAFVRV